MRTLLLIITLLSGVSVLAADKEAGSIAAADKIVWAGLDFSHTRFIGPGQFKQPESIFPGMLDAWNNLVLKERMKYLEKDLGKPLTVDIKGVTEVNQSAGKKQIINSPGAGDTIQKTRITPEMIAKAVRSYHLTNKTGVAVVFIIDRFVKIDRKGEGAVYVVAFDIGSRKVLFSKRVVSRAGGWGFRNYWFRVIKNSEVALKKIR